MRIAKSQIIVAQVLLSHLNLSLIVFELSSHTKVNRLVSVAGIKSKTTQNQTL